MHNLFKGSHNLTSNFRRAWVWIIFRIYAKVPTRRKIIRKVVYELFTDIIYDQRQYHGITDVLQWFSEIIRGFAVPFREEHFESLKLYVLPLLRLKWSENLYTSITNLWYFYAEKNNEIIRLMIKSMIKFWPKDDSAKEIIFIQTLSKILKIRDG